MAGGLRLILPVNSARFFGLHQWPLKDLEYKSVFLLLMPRAHSQILLIRTPLCLETTVLYLKSCEDDDDEEK
jgi:hypothetical protein